MFDSSSSIKSATGRHPRSVSVSGALVWLSCVCRLCGSFPCAVCACPVVLVWCACLVWFLVPVTVQIQLVPVSSDAWTKSDRFLASLY